MADNAKRENQEPIEVCVVTAAAVASDSDALGELVELLARIARADEVAA